MSIPANKLYVQTKDLIPGNLAIDFIFKHLVCSPTFLSSLIPAGLGGCQGNSFKRINGLWIRLQAIAGL